MQNIELFNNYENAKILSAEDYRRIHKNETYEFDRLPEQDIDGIPICVTRNENGKLEVTFVKDTHLLAIGATRSGKTTGFVLPTLNIMLKKKNKPSLVISDPKQELYSSCAKSFEKEGYRIILLDFADYMHSDCWNPLTKCYRYYQQYLHVANEVHAVVKNGKAAYTFMGKVYYDEDDLELDVSEARERFFDESEKVITTLSASIVPTLNTRDPYWEDSARDLLCAILYGMLEDSEEGKITEDNFSFSTVLSIFDRFNESTVDGGYFKHRPESSKARQLASKCILEQAQNTRKCIISSLAAKLSKFRDTAVKRVTCANTFEISSFDDGTPTAVFISYKDENSLHYEVISMFLSNLYTELIAIAREKGSQLERPFYFLLDEFGNLPKFNDFEKVISACGGRNIWFLLILQSYAQLYNVYDKSIAEIIKDNLNLHIFFGTNNPETKKEFSQECGQKTIISPVSALNGSGESINGYVMDTVSLVPVSRLTKILPGECIVTQMGEDVLWSKMERSYNCPEFQGEKTTPSARGARLKFFDPKYHFDPFDRSGYSDDDDEF